MFIDPEGSDDDEIESDQNDKPLMDLRGKREEDMNAAELKELARQREIAARKARREALLKEIKKNFAHRDKRATHKFLMKHGLTEKEAKRYTELNMEFDTK